MSTVSRDELKQKGIKRLVKSFGYAIDGLKYAFKYEQNLTVHIVATILVIVFGILFNISSFEWLLIFLCIGLVIATELLNTSIEATIDLISPNKHPLAKVAKDTAAAAVLVFAITAIIVGFIIFIPKIAVYLGALLWEAALSV